MAEVVEEEVAEEVGALSILVRWAVEGVTVEGVRATAGAEKQAEADAGAEAEAGAGITCCFCCFCSFCCCCGH